MHLSLTDFCQVIKGLGRTNAEKAVAVIWFHDRKQPDLMMTSRQLTKILDDHHVGTPNPTQLADTIRKTKLVAEHKDGFSLKPGSRNLVLGWLPAGIDGMQPAMDHSVGYLPEALWADTRGYIESVCRQLNGCFRAAYYDAASVMLRRLLETLIIEAYEDLGREQEIKDANGNIFLLKDLVERACGEKGHAGLKLGRDSKAVLKEARDVGNWSAHARRYNAFAADLEKIQSRIRLAVQELAHIAGLTKSTG